MMRVFARGESRRLAGVGLLGLVVGGVMLLVSFRPAPPTPFIALPQPCRFPVPLRERLGGWIPGKASWAWRLEQALFGKRKTINLFAELLVFDGPATNCISRLGVGAAHFSDGKHLQAWLLTSAELRAARERCKQAPEMSVLNSPRISTADSVNATLFVGQSVPIRGTMQEVGLTMNFLPLVRSAKIDLFSHIRFSELLTNHPGPIGSESAAIQTNMDAAFRVQVPKGKGLLLLNADSESARQRPVAILLGPP